MQILAPVVAARASARTRPVRWSASEALAGEHRLFRRQDARVHPATRSRRRAGRSRSSGQRFIATVRPACFRLLGRRIVAYRELHPDHLRRRVERQRLVGDRPCRLRVAEDLDHVDRRRHVGEPAVDLAPEDLLAGKPGIDRVDLVAAVLEVFRARSSSAARACARRRRGRPSSPLSGSRGCSCRGSCRGSWS